MKVLIIEDEKELRRSVLVYLHKEGYVLESANDYPTASDKINDYDYDCILLDLNLPGGNGLDILRNLKKNKPDTGVIIISARNSLDDKIDGLELGADDYLTKPFHLSELNARIKSVIRRRHFDGNKEIRFGNISVNPDSGVVMINEKELSLTKKELELLLYFISNKNRLITKESLAEHLWGDHMDMADNYDFIYSHIKNLRKKLIENGAEDYIKTVYGTGYRFSEE